MQSNCNMSGAVAPVAPASQLPDDAVQVLVRRTSGLPGKDGRAATSLPAPVQIQHALMHAWDNDAHLVAYQPVQWRGHWVRLNLHDRPNDFALFQLIKEGAIPPVVMQWRMFDVDAPNKAPTAEWWNHIERNLPTGDKRPVYYRTAGGCHLIWKLASPFVVSSREGYARWRREYFACAAALERLYQIKVDDACADITRLQRLPSVKRDDGKPCPSPQPFPMTWAPPNDWTIKLTTADWRKAEARTRKADAEAEQQARTAKLRQQQSEQALGTQRGDLLDLATQHYPGPGHRNAAMYSLACSLAKQGWKDGEVEDFITELADRVDASDCRHEINSACAAVEGGGGSGWPELEKQWGETFKSEFGRLHHPFRDAKEGLLADDAQTPEESGALARPEAADALALSQALLSTGELLFAAERKQWLVWDGTRWVFDKLDRPSQAVAKLLNQTTAEGAFSDADLAYAKNHLGAVVATAARLKTVAFEGFDAQPDLYNLQDCTLNLRTLEAKAHDRRDMLTKRVEIGLVAASDDNKSAWQDFVTSIFVDADGKHDPELAAFVQRAVGYSLTGRGTEKAFFWCSGNSNSGKSTFLAMLQELLGEYACTTNASVFTRRRNLDGGSGHTADLIPMVGCRVAVVDELYDAPFNTQLINLITGGGSMSVSNKGEKPFPWKPRLALWLGSETEPSYDTNITGFRNRLRKIPFLATFAIDPTFKARLLQPGVVLAALWWALEGLLLYDAAGLGSCAAVKASTDTYAEEQDNPIAAFVDEACVVGEGWTASGELHARYVAWRREHGYAAAPENPRQFGKRLALVPGLAAQKGTAGVRGWNVRGHSPDMFPG